MKIRRYAVKTYKISLGLIPFLNGMGTWASFSLNMIIDIHRNTLFQRSSAYYGSMEEVKKKMTFTLLCW